jgi:hypothetical protein
MSAEADEGAGMDGGEEEIKERVICLGEAAAE